MTDPITRDRLDDIALDLDGGEPVPEVTAEGTDEEGRPTRTLTDGTIMYRSHTGNWLYPGWHPDERHLDRVRPGDENRGRGPLSEDAAQAIALDDFDGGDDAPPPSASSEGCANWDCASRGRGRAQFERADSSGITGMVCRACSRLPEVELSFA